MSSGTLTTNGSTDWYQVRFDDGVGFSFKGTWGGGTVALEQKIISTPYPYLDENDVAITFTANANRVMDIKSGSWIRATLTGATTPAIEWEFTGKFT
jgi:hypothetical protein